MDDDGFGQDFIRLALNRCGRGGSELDIVFVFLLVVLGFLAELLEFVVVPWLELSGRLQEVYDLVEVQIRLCQHLRNVVLAAVQPVHSQKQLLRDNVLLVGVAAIVAMLHDILVLVGVFCGLGFFLNWKIDSMFVTAALTVVGFSVHDTIIIFDRIRENLNLRGSKVTFSGIVSESINETFARSVFTSGTVIMTLLALLIFGGPVIRPLNAALLIGILSGTYSSIFNAAPLVVDWQRRFGKKGDTSMGVAEETGK